MNAVAANDGGRLKLLLGCGKSKLPGYLGVDISCQSGADLLCNLQ